jgi:hypothetical protein
MKDNNSYNQPGRQLYDIGLAGYVSLLFTRYAMMINQPQNNDRQK